MTNLLLIIPNLGFGGAQKIFREQLRFYAAHFNVIGCVFNKDHFIDVDKQLSLISLDVPAGKNLFGKVIYLILRTWRLRALKKKYAVAVTISHLEGADYINILSGRKEKKIGWVHGTKKFDNEIRGALGWLRRKILIPLLYKRFDKIICVSQGIRSELISTYNFRPYMLDVIPNGFDVDNILRLTGNNSMDSIMNVLAGKRVLVTHSRLAPQKNIRAIIEIYTKVSQLSKAKLVVIGDGELRDELLSQVESAGLKLYSIWRNDLLTDENDVYFVGYQENPFPLLSKCSIYLMTSLWEGFPLSLGEAMVCGIAPVVADCFTGPREILAPERIAPQPILTPVHTPSGVLMPLANTESSWQLWADEICKLLEDDFKRKRMAEKAKVRIKHFDQREIQRKWLQLIYE